MTDSDGRGTSDDEEVDDLIDDEVNEEYEVTFGHNSHRAAEFGSLMVSMMMVSKDMQDWAENGDLPETAQIEEKQKMLRDALEEAPLDDLNPESSAFDEQIQDIVEYARELVTQLDNFKSAREAVEEAAQQIDYYEEQFEFFRRGVKGDDTDQ